MVVLPGVIFVASEIPRIIFNVVRWRSGYLQHTLPEFVLYLVACVGAFAILWAISRGLERAAPGMKHPKVFLAAADVVGRGITLLEVILLGIGVCVGAFFTLSQALDGSIDLDEAFYLIHTLALIAAGLFLTGWVGIRRRTPIGCARCGYRIGSVRAAGEVCPECGNRWMRVGELRRFRRISSWWLVGAIALLVLDGAAWFVAR